MAEVLSFQEEENLTQPSKQQHVSTSQISPHTKKGVILGPDGKPCRSCNSFRDFVGATAGIAGPAVPKNAPSECPPDVEQLGRAGWTLLHTIAASYPSEATSTQQYEMKTFMMIFAKIYPCWSCAKDFRQWMSRPENNVENAIQGRKTFGRWLCEAHNDVNTKLGKKTFDCRKWEERWRTGGEGC
ncbi:FAD-linked sulfhydryl oxidase ALR [Trichophaea hybrida]|nr:FAD-linked sulfhydryl oxidase ALR [Trichophaea hybrida]